MEEVSVGLVGLGNVGSGTLAILAENADQIALKLGFQLKVAAVCSRSVHAKAIPSSLGTVFKTTDWREVVESSRRPSGCRTGGRDRSSGGDH